MIQKTILIVEKIKGRKHWVIKRCDSDRDLIGTITTIGIPYRAKDCPVGSSFMTVFYMPDKK